MTQWKYLSWSQVSVNVYDMSSYDTNIEAKYYIYKYYIAIQLWSVLWIVYTYVYAHMHVCMCMSMYV